MRPEWAARRAVYGCGTIPARIAFVAEAPGATEERDGMPLVGGAGHELRSMLTLAGIDLNAEYRTNVISRRPIDNDFKEFCVNKRDQTVLASALLDTPAAASRWASFGVARPIEPPGGFLHPDFWPELERLAEEIKRVRPNIICVLGNKALWAVLHTIGIRAVRGTIARCLLPGCEGIKVLATYHPAAVMRDYSLRPIVVSDFFKLARFCNDREFVRPRRVLHLCDTPAELEDALKDERRLAVDIETARGQITSISLSPDPWRAYVVGFARHDGTSIHDEPVEVDFWRVLRQLLDDYRRETIYHNGLYDMQYLWRVSGIASPSAREDTMIQHHAMFPEMPKSLGFLGSVYTDEPAWKQLSKVARNKTEKVGDEE